MYYFYTALENGKTITGFVRGYSEALALTEFHKYHPSATLISLVGE